MARQRRRQSAGEWLSKRLDLPPDVLGGLPLAELKGDCQLRVENHRGILAYDPEEIHIGGKVILRVRGEGLELKAMRRGELLITGKIFSVEPE